MIDKNFFPLICWIYNNNKFYGSAEEIKVEVEGDRRDLFVEGGLGSSFGQDRWSESKYGKVDIEEEVKVTTDRFRMRRKFRVESIWRTVRLGDVVTTVGPCWQET